MPVPSESHKVFIILQTRRGAALIAAYFKITSFLRYHMFILVQKPRGDRPLTHASHSHQMRLIIIIIIVINTVLLLGAPMLPTRWVKISTYLQSEQFLSIIFILMNLNPLILCVELNYYYYYILMYLNLN
jgi:hypothetical protein